jgi:hypothetical protein
MDTTSETNDQAGTAHNVTGTTPDNRTDTLANAIRHAAKSYPDSGVNAWTLANLSDCATPDRIGHDPSPGARMLTSVRDAVAELIEENADELAELGPDVGAYDWRDLLDYSGALHMIADGAPSIYTGEKWAQFVDLGAYNEAPIELGWEGSDMDQAGSVCLYMIAERCAMAVLEGIHQDTTDALDYPDDDDTDQG